MIKPVKKMVKKVETVMVDEKYWDTKWIAVQVVSPFDFYSSESNARGNLLVSSGSENCHGRSSRFSRRRGFKAIFQISMQKCV